MRRFRKLYPDVEFSLRNILTSDQVGMIQNRTLDVGFLRLPIEGVKGIEVVTVHREPLVVVLPLNHRFASGNEIRLRELRGEKFVMYERHFAPGFHDFLVAILNRAGVVPDVSQTASEMSTLVSLVDSGLGVAVLPASAVKQRVAKIAICSIVDRIPPSEIGMIFAKQANVPAIENFCGLAKTLSRI
jgi:DNA-binding transcriptional LysR family regulator